MGKIYRFYQPIKNRRLIACRNSRISFAFDSLGSKAFRQKYPNHLGSLIEGQLPRSLPKINFVKSLAKAAGAFLLAAGLTYTVASNYQRTSEERKIEMPYYSQR